MEGPAFSTRAESLMHRLWGGDLVGMTAMPEAKLAREAELPYALIALVTDYDCWRDTGRILSEKAAATGEPPKQKHELLNEIISNLKAASENAIALMKAAVERIAHHPAMLEECPARTALELAIWSNKEKLAQDEIDRLWPLWGRYFPRP
jgi:5'-methylthioadenosine phosphorylase